MARIVCAGHVNWDVTLQVDHLPVADGEARIRSESQSCGGSAANTAVGLAGLGLDVTLLGSIGDDEHGLLTRRALERAGVHLSLTVVDGGQTAVKYLLVDDEGEVAVLGTDGDNEAVGPADVDASLLDGADHLHLTSQLPDTAARLARIAGGRNMPVSFDPGRRLDKRDYTSVLERADILFLNEREATQLEIPRSDTFVLTTYGSDGAILEDGDVQIQHPGFALESVDSTGAGDAFAAGFLASRLREYPDERALAVANACGGLAAQEEGGQAVLRWEAVESLLDESR